MSVPPAPIEACAFDMFPAAAAVVDADGRLVQTNAAWSESDAALGVFDRSVGDDLLDALTTADRKESAFSPRVRAVLEASAESCSGVLAANSEHVWVGRAAGFDHADDHYAVVVFVDVAETQRTGLTSRERVRQLENAVRILSHDLRTSINVISGYASTLTDEDVAVERIQEASARAETIIADALTLAQSTGTREIERIDFRDVVNAVWADVDGDSAATLDVAESVTFEGDRGLVRRLFANLFANAIQHGGADVTVRVGVLPEPESATVGVYVEDDGTGFDVDEVEHVFSPGYTSQADGYGLGLTIVYGVVEAHGWAITATNGDDGGARFEISGITSPDA